MVDQTAADVAQPVRTLNDIPGWFPWTDQRMFGHFLSADAVVPRGDVVELGVYMGKSAALIGDHVDADETFTVCDLFGAESDDEANRRENARSYSTLDRRAFERNYLAMHAGLPVIVQGLSSTITDHVAPGTVRFMHVDASHLYDHVVVDVESATKLLKPDAVVAFDDYRSSHTPGVSAAVWEAVFTRGLQPICLTDQKLYGTFGDRAAHQQHLLAWAARTPGLWWTEEVIAGARVFRFAPAPKPKAPKGPDPAATAARVDQLVKRLSDTEDHIAGVDRRLNIQHKRIARLEIAARKISPARRVARKVENFTRKSG